MSRLSAVELKKKLRAEGFEIYRTRDEQVMLAERVRDNLIMDSGVTAETGAEYAVSVTVRAQMSHFPGAAPAELLTHARQLAAAFEGHGYTAEEPTTTAMKDPGDPERVLDTLFELRLRKQVESLEALLSELRTALSETRTTGDD